MDLPVSGRVLDKIIIRALEHRDLGGSINFSPQDICNGLEFTGMAKEEQITPGYMDVLLKYISDVEPDIFVKLDVCAIAGLSLFRIKGGAEKFIEKGGFTAFEAKQLAKEAQSEKDAELQRRTNQATIDAAEAAKISAKAAIDSKKWAMIAAIGTIIAAAAAVAAFIFG